MSAERKPSTDQSAINALLASAAAKEREAEAIRLKDGDCYLAFMAEDEAKQARKLAEKLKNGS